jgi:transposase-like protein
MRFSEEIVWRCLYLYFKFPVSLRDVVEMMRDRGVTVHHTSIYRWVLKFGPILEERFRKHKMPVNVSWRMDETYIKVNGQWKYLYRAVDKFGQTIDFLLRAKRDHKAAMRFFKRAIKASGSPKTVVIDGSYTNKGALQTINHESRKNNPIVISKDRYLNNRIEQDHRKVKRKMKMSMSFKTMRGAKAIIAGVEILHMIYKGQSGYLPLLSENPLQAFWNLALQ